MEPYTPEYSAFFDEAKLKGLIVQNNINLNNRDRNSLVNKQVKKDPNKNDYAKEIEELFIGRYDPDAFNIDLFDVPF